MRRLRSEGLLALAIAGLLLTGCGGATSPGPDAGPTRSASTSAGAGQQPATPSSTGSATPTPSGQEPPDPAVLAAQLDSAVVTINDSDATPDAVRQAAEQQQLGIRALARGPAGLRRAVLASLRPATAGETRAQLRAAALLTELTEPRVKFPPWRIVEPPPPDVLLGYYREAQRLTGVPWTYLAAIHLVETRMGRIRGPSTAGALGPMQFMPATWARYGAGGDINDPRDAVMAAARLLKDHGAPRDMAGALWHYNPSSRYVGAVTEYARTMQVSPAAYRGYWGWQVFCQLRRGAYLLPVGYPGVRPVPLPGG
jgi:soluble lytic murein transglycosylase-like protein